MTARAMISPKKLSLEKALHLLRKPDVRLVRLHSNNGGAGFYIWPDGGRVPDDVAHLLLERNDVQPYDSGLFPGHPQSWRLGNLARASRPAWPLGNSASGHAGRSARRG